MVAHEEDDCGGGEFERTLDHLARVDRRVIDGALLLLLVGNELVLLVEEQDAQRLFVGERHGSAAIVEHRGPRREHSAALQFGARHALGGGLDDLELGDRGFPDAVDLAQARRRSRDYLGKGAEPGEQGLGERLHVDARLRVA